MDPSVKLMPNQCKPVSQLEYSHAIGCLMYAMTSTRPDIAYKVGRLRRYTSNPSTQHWQVVQVPQGNHGLWFVLFGISFGFRRVF